MFWHYVSTVSTLEIIVLFKTDHAQTSYLLTGQEAHKEYNSLVVQIWARYEQLDSGKFGAVGTSAFNAEACQLANLFAYMSQICQRLNLPMPKEFHRPMFFKH